MQRLIDCPSATISLAEVLPVVYPVKIHASGKQIGVARQRLRCQQSTVGASPNADSIWVDVRKGGQKALRSNHILVLRCPTWTLIGGATKRLPVTDSASIVHG